MTDNEFVLAHLQKWGSITPKEAYARYGIMRLGARIWDLRHKYGYDIESKPVGFRKNGHHGYYTKYIWRGERVG